MTKSRKEQITRNIKYTLEQLSEADDARSLEKVADLLNKQSHAIARIARNMQAEELRIASEKANSEDIEVDRNSDSYKSLLSVLS